MRNSKRFFVAVVIATMCFLSVACTSKTSTIPYLNLSSEVSFTGKALLLVEKNECDNDFCSELLILKYSQENPEKPDLIKSYSIIQLRGPINNTMSDYVRISSNNQYFVFKARENGKLMVSNSDGQVVFIIDEPVTEFSLSSDARYLAYLVPQGNVVTTTSSGTAYDEIITMSRSGEASLNVLDLKTGEKKLVVTAVDIDGNLIWSPNTEYIRLCNMECIDIQLDGSQQLDNNKYQWLAPNGISRVRLNADQGILLLEVGNGITYEIFSWQPFQFRFSVYWSYDSQKVAVITPMGVGFVRSSDGDQDWLEHETLTWNQDFVTPDHTLDSFYFQAKGAWSPDSSRFAYENNKNLILMDFNSNTVVGIENHVIPGTYPTWINDENLLGFVFSFQGQKRVGLYNYYNDQIYMLPLIDGYQILDFVQLSP